MKYFISILIIFCAVSGVAQQRDTLRTSSQPRISLKKDTVKEKRSKWLPTGVRFGIDAVPIVRSALNDSISAFLVMADIDFNKLLLTGEFGTLSRTRGGVAGIYNVDGSFWRTGVDVNLFKQGNDEAAFTLGFRYGRSTFSDELVTTTFDPVFGNSDRILQNNDINGDWIELVAGLKVKVWKLWMGYNFRMKIGIDDFDENLAPYEVPGYGLAAEEDYWEFNYFLMYRVEWK